MRTGLNFFDKDNNPIENRNSIHRFEWSKLDNGMIKELRYNLAEEETVMNPFCPFYELRFEYDQSGYVTMMSNYQADTLYDCTAENCGDIGVSYFKFVNNEHGDLLNFSVHNTVGQLSNLYSGWAKREMTVDQNGYVTELVIYDQDDELLSGNGVPVIRNSYDEHGAVVEVQSLNKEKVLMNNPNNGVAIVQYVYDEKGNRTETIRLDKDRVAVVSE
jgi:YD repeat-containing protein